jgi:hypothetical protein
MYGKTGHTMSIGGIGAQKYSRSPDALCVATEYSDRHNAPNNVAPYRLSRHINEQMPCRNWSLTKSLAIAEQIGRHPSRIGLEDCHKLSVRYFRRTCGGDSRTSKQGVLSRPAKHGPSTS